MDPCLLIFKHVDGWAKREGGRGGLGVMSGTASRCQESRRELSSWQRFIVIKKDAETDEGGKDVGRVQTDERRSSEMEPELWSFNRCSARSPGDCPFRQGRNPTHWWIRERSEKKGLKKHLRHTRARTHAYICTSPSPTSTAWIPSEDCLVTRWLAAHPVDVLHQQCTPTAGISATSHTRTDMHQSTAGGEIQLLHTPDAEKKTACLWLYKCVCTGTLHEDFICPCVHTYTNTHSCDSENRDGSKLSCEHRRWGRWRGRPAWGTASQRACLRGCVCRGECVCSSRALHFHLWVTGSGCAGSSKAAVRSLCRIAFFVRGERACLCVEMPRCVWSQRQMCREQNGHQRFKQDYDCGCLKAHLSACLVTGRTDWVTSISIRRPGLLGLLTHTGRVSGTESHFYKGHRSC